MTLPIVLAESIADGWRPGIGDPSIGGWATVAAYFASAVACWLASMAERRAGPGPDSDPSAKIAHPIFWRPGFDRPSPEIMGASRPAGADSVGRRVLFWRLLAVGLVMLGINKQLDLQSLLPVVGRRVARAQGWYEDRQAVQRAFISAVAVLGIGTLALFSYLFRSIVLRRPMAPIGLVFLFAFVLVRASSFHRVDVLLGDTILGVRVNLLLELGGIALVFLAATRCAREGRAPEEGGSRQ